MFVHVAERLSLTVLKAFLNVNNVNFVHMIIARSVATRRGSSHGDSRMMMVLLPEERFAKDAITNSGLKKSLKASKTKWTYLQEKKKQKLPKLMN